MVDAAGGRARRRIASGLDPARVWAVIPCHREPPAPALVHQVRALVGGVVLVGDGLAPEAAARVARLAREAGAELVRLPENAGKGHALAAGLEHLLARRPVPEAVLVLDADGQHPPEAIPAFVAAAAEAELVVGDRLGDAAAMPWQRQLANRVVSRILAWLTGQAVGDSQCGMRLLRGRALHTVPLPAGRYESETAHLRRCLREGVRVAWVPIPALYEGQQSSFRPLRDSLRVLAALVG